MDELLLRRIISEEIARAQEGMDERLRRIISEEVARAHFSVQQGSAASATGPIGDDEEEELQQLMSEMMELKVGLRKACVPFARSLAEQGVMSLKDLPDQQFNDHEKKRNVFHDARIILRKSGMQELQIDKVVLKYLGDEVATFSLFD
jgi:hypothetical protein